MYEIVKKAFIADYLFPVEMKMAYCVDGLEGLKESIQEYYKSGFLIAIKGKEDKKITPKELIKYLEPMIGREIWPEMNGTREERILSLLRENGSLIRLLPEKEQETYEKVAVYESNSPASLRDLPGTKNYEIIRHMAKTQSNFTCQFTEDIAKRFTNEQLAEIISICPDVVAAGHIKNLITKDLFMVFLEAMVTGHKDYILGYPNTVYGKYMDVFAYRCYGMVDGFNLYQVPEELKETVITDKLIWYCLNNQKSYVGFNWLLEGIPESRKTEAICLECCKHHPWAIEHVPEKFQNMDFYQKLLAEGGSSFMEHIPEKYKNRIPKDVYANLDKAGSLLTKRDISAMPEIWDKISKEQKAFEILPENAWTKERYLHHLKVNGCGLSHVPVKELDMEMCKTALLQNPRAWHYVPEDFRTDELFCFIRDNGIDIMDIPEQYKTEEFYIRLIEERRIDLEEIPKEKQTSRVLSVYLSYYPTETMGIGDGANADFVRQLIKNIVNSGKPNDCWPIQFLIKSVAPENRPVEIVNDLLGKVNGMVSLEGLTKEQIDIGVAAFPNSIWMAPDWYINDYVNSGEVQSTSQDKPCPKEKAKTVPTPDILVGNWEQISIFDILSV